MQEYCRIIIKNSVLDSFIRLQLDSLIWETADGHPNPGQSSETANQCVFCLTVDKSLI